MCNSTGTKPIFHCKMSCLPMPLSNTTKPYHPHDSFFPRNHASASIHCRELKFKCRNRYLDEAVDHPLTTSSACEVLGVEPNCSAAQLKAAFRARVKEFHPDLRKNRGDSDVMIRRVIQAYEMLSNYSRSEIIERECLDPFDNPECEALDVFVNEVMCVGQGHYEDSQVQQAVGQCPRSCMHCVTPSQRIILEELLDSILDVPYNTSVEAELLYSLIVKAKYENNRYQQPKRHPKSSTQRMDWF